MRCGGYVGLSAPRPAPLASTQKMAFAPLLVTHILPFASKTACSGEIKL